MFECLWWMTLGGSGKVEKMGGRLVDNWQSGGEVETRWKMWWG